MVDGHDLTIVPGDRDRIPTRSGDSAAIGGITSPEYPIALFEVLRFGSGHAAPPLISDWEWVPCIFICGVYDFAYRWPQGSPRESGANEEGRG